MSALPSFWKKEIASYLKLTALTGNRSIFYHVLQACKLFSHKTLNNVFYLNKSSLCFKKRLHLFVLSAKLMTVLHLFYECDITQNLWKGLALFFGNDCSTLFDLTPQAAFLGFLSANLRQFLIQN